MYFYWPIKLYDCVYLGSGSFIDIPSLSLFPLSMQTLAMENWFKIDSFEWLRYNIERTSFSCSNPPLMTISVILTKQEIVSSDILTPLFVIRSPPSSGLSKEDITGAGERYLWWLRITSIGNDETSPLTSPSDNKSIVAYSSSFASAVKIMSARQCLTRRPVYYSTACR